MSHFVPVLNRLTLCSAEPCLIFVAECICSRIRFKYISPANRKSFYSSCPLLGNSGRSSQIPQAIEQLACCLIGGRILPKRKRERGREFAPGSQSSSLLYLLPYVHSCCKQSRSLCSIILDNYTAINHQSKRDFTQILSSRL